jgi:hypothetical protein
MREASIEESLVQIYLAGLSVRHMQDIAERLWGDMRKPIGSQRIKPKRFRGSNNTP